MWKSPIKAIMDGIALDMAKEFDDTVVRAVNHVGIVVDKDELVKALEYDRDQYDKGFDDGYAAGVADASPKTGKWIPDDEDDPHLVVPIRCSVCHSRAHFEDWNRRFVLSEYCPHCGAKMEVGEDG